MKQGTMIRKLVVFIAAISLALGASMSRAQQNMSALKPPPGAHVAIFEFYDLECPMCARENPVLKEAAEKYHAPWLRHDFPLPQHVWSFQAAVNARWFDEQPKHLGNEYRDAVFANQVAIETKDDLRQFTDKFAQQHGVAMPFLIDPQGKLTAEVKADYALAQRMSVNSTPTTYVVTDRSGGAPPYTLVSDYSKLFTMLDEAVAQTGHGAKR
jgi:protein-disulfide isomerase